MSKAAANVKPAKQDHVTIDATMVMYVFGKSLRDSGFQQIIRTWKELEELLDDKDIETFSRYMSKQAFEGDFVRTFWQARKLELTAVGWWDAGVVDKTLIRQDPEWDQSIKEYFEKVFKKAIV